MGADAGMKDMLSLRGLKQKTANISTLYALFLPPLLPAPLGLPLLIPAPYYSEPLPCLSYTCLSQFFPNHLVDYFKQMYFRFLHNKINFNSIHSI